MKIAKATRLYEMWLAKQSPLVRKDVTLKHTLMGRDAQASPASLRPSGWEPLIGVGLIDIYVPGVRFDVIRDQERREVL